jgi:hypothetical protein
MAGVVRSRHFNNEGCPISRAILFIVAVSCLGFAPAPFLVRSRPDAGSDLQRMQGTWRVESVRVEGQKEELRAGRWHVVITRDQAHLRQDREPRAFDLSAQTAARGGKGHLLLRDPVVKWRGLAVEYRLEGDRLLLKVDTWIDPTMLPRLPICPPPKSPTIWSLARVRR